MIHIACNIDRNYVKYCGVTLTSIFENNPELGFTVHIVESGLTEADHRILSDLAAHYGHSVRFYAPDENLLRGFSIRRFSKRITMATYYRCILSALLPTDIDRVIYLDCDIIITGDLRPFYTLPIDDVAVAAVEDVGCGEAARYDVLCYPMADSYFNAGVLLVNLRYWREHNVPQACADYYRQYPERILFNDQDLLNCVLHDAKRLVDQKWNVQDGFYRRPRTMSEEWRAKWADVLRHPVILHYTNRKPWSYDSQHPLRHLWAEYLALTPWRDEQPLGRLTDRLKRFSRLLPFRLGLRAPKYVDMDKL